MDGKTVIEADPSKRANLAAAIELLDSKDHRLLTDRFFLKRGDEALCRVVGPYERDERFVAAMVLSKGLYFGAQVVAPVEVDGVRIEEDTFVIGTVPEDLPSAEVPTAWDMTWRLLVPEAS